ncbi:hypothetical protein L7F22_038334 [Adiantum nelumboides]|nr:hypothetical protein [Adiantum nelumboides]
MTILSAIFGWAAPNLIPRRLTHHLATVLFFVFGSRSFWDAFTKKDGEASELAEVEAELDDNKKGSKKGSTFEADDLKKQQRPLLTMFFSPILLETFSLTFFGEWGDKSQIATIGLAAEESAVGVALGGILIHAATGAAARIVYVKGNKKNVIVNAFSRNPLISAVIATFDHALDDMRDQYATVPDSDKVIEKIQDGEVAPVCGGKHLASRISEKTVACCAGLVFFAFGIHSLLSGGD